MDLGSPHASATWAEDKGWKETPYATFGRLNPASVLLRLLDTIWGWAGWALGCFCCWSRPSLWRSVQGGGGSTYADRAHIIFGSLKPHCDCSLGQSMSVGCSLSWESHFSRNTLSPAPGLCEPPECLPDPGMESLVGIGQLL